MTNQATRLSTGNTRPTPATTKSLLLQQPARSSGVPLSRDHDTPGALAASRLQPDTAAEAAAGGLAVTAPMGCKLIGRCRRGLPSTGRSTPA